METTHIDIQGLIDDGHLDLDDIFDSDWEVKQVIASYGAHFSGSMDERTDMEVILEVAERYGITAYRWAEREADGQYGGEHGEATLDRDEAIADGKDYAAENDESDIADERAAEAEKRRERQQAEEDARAEEAWQDEQDRVAEEDRRETEEAARELRQAGFTGKTIRPWMDLGVEVEDAARFRDAGLTPDRVIERAERLLPRCEDPIIYGLYAGLLSVEQIITGPVR